MVVALGTLEIVHRCGVAVLVAYVWIQPASIVEVAVFVDVTVRFAFMVVVAVNDHGAVIVVRAAMAPRFKLSGC